jgi:hypothetical protein
MNLLVALIAAIELREGFLENMLPMVPMLPRLQQSPDNSDPQQSFAIVAIAML